ncbi:MAG: hypothetical protein LBR38_01940 [Synergistaceae bacterium]|jgi:hypothetical protein|nr:hypothetical protein [Synergistaceae bacterium]
MIQYSLDLDGKQPVKKNFGECGRANCCIMLRDGRLYTCTFPAYAHLFNECFGERLPVADEDSIDIYRAKDAREVMNFLSRPIPFCRFCRVSEWTDGHKWRVSEGKMEEWAARTR